MILLLMQCSFGDNETARSSGYEILPETTVICESGVEVHRMKAKIDWSNDSFMVSKRIGDGSGISHSFVSQCEFEATPCGEQFSIATFASSRAGYPSHFIVLTP